jgi:hypothetical protein
VVLKQEAQEAKKLGPGDEIEDAVDRITFEGRPPWRSRWRRDDKGRRASHRYSRDFQAAWRAVTERFTECLWDEVSLTSEWDAGLCQQRWRCEVTGYGYRWNATARRLEPDCQKSWQADGEGETPALAICRAMLDIEDGTDDRTDA